MRSRTYKQQRVIIDGDTARLYDHQGIEILLDAADVPLLAVTCTPQCGQE